MWNKTKWIPALILCGLLIVGFFPAPLRGLAQSASGWGVPVNISDSGGANHPVAVVDSTGVLHVIWVDAVDGYRYAQSKDEGKTWSAPVTVPYPFDPIKDPAPTLIADGDGAIHVFWLKATSELFYSRATSTNFGDPANWASTLINKSVANFSAIIDSGNTLNLAFIVNLTDEQGSAGVYYQRAIEGRGIWSNPVLLYRSEYFRAATSLTTAVGVAASNDVSGQKIYVSWDDRPQKRIFLAKSIDAGKSWVEPVQFKGPQDFGTSGTPFNFSVWADGQKVLLVWQVGEPGASKCSVFSDASDDGGATWKDVINLFGGPTACPARTNFVFSESGKVAVSFNAPGDPALIAWDGSRWSNQQSQIGLPALSNPDTFDPILLGCRQDLFYKNDLIVIGCDQAKGGDIWTVTRTLSPIKDWFVSSIVWSDPAVLETEAQPITAMLSIADSRGNLHALWVETPSTPEDGKPLFKYTRWDGTLWSTPETIIRNLDGNPIAPAVFLDKQERLLLTWIDGSKGDILFSWANLQQAGLSSGWETSTVLPSPSQLNSSPDIIADGNGRIVVAYAIEYNEGRGIYIVQSTDNGVTWSPYIQAFDGTENRWEFVDSPRVALGGDGTLHLLFTRRSTWSTQPFGLYYSQSRDGGVTWTEAQPVSEGKVSWSEIVTDGDQVVHRLWQEQNDLVVANLSQMSEDGGKSWGPVKDITGVSEHPTQVALSAPGNGDLYFVQLFRQEDATLSDMVKVSLQASVWRDASWNPDPAYSLSLRGVAVVDGLVAGMSSQGYLGVLFPNAFVNAKGITEQQMLSVGRSLDGFSNTTNAALSGIMPEPVFSAESVDAAGSASTPTPEIDTSILYDSNDPSQGLARNLVGVGVIVVGMLMVLYFLIRPRAARRP